MGEANNILAITLIVVTAGSAIYTIKTYMRPGMKIAVNFAEIDPQSLNDEFESAKPTKQTSRRTTITTLSSNLLSRETTTPIPRLVNQNQRPIIEKSFENSFDFDHTEYESESEPVKKRGIVKTKLGDIEGIEQDVFGKKIFAFLGVHYAMPPIGELRFKKPKPIEPWNGVKMAKQYGSPCLQILPNATDLPITLLRRDFSEDCLHLNIWTSSLDKPLKPVLMFIHGLYY